MARPTPAARTDPQGARESAVRRPRATERTNERRHGSVPVTSIRRSRRRRRRRRRFRSPSRGRTWIFRSRTVRSRHTVLQYERGNTTGSVQPPLQSPPPPPKIRDDTGPVNP